MVAALVALLTLGLGWVEDLAARRRPQIIPLPKRTRVPILEEQPQPVPA
jgi:hypothetical protein